MLTDFQRSALVAPLAPLARPSGMRGSYLASIGYRLWLVGVAVVPLLVMRGCNVVAIMRTCDVAVCITV